APDFAYLAFLRRELVKPLLDHLAEAMRELKRHRCIKGLHTEYTLCSRIFCQMDHKERIAIATCVDELCQSLRQERSWEACRQVGVHCGDAQQGQREFLAVATHLQVLDKGGEGMSCAPYLIRAIRPDEEESGRVLSSCQEREHVQGGRI